MSHLGFALELHRDPSTNLLTIVSAKTQLVDSWGSFSISDVSEAFNPLPHSVSGFAYSVSFSLPLDGQGDLIPTWSETEDCDETST